MQAIPVVNLSIALVPALIVVGILWRWSLGAKSSIYALARMIVQLCLIGYALTYIFETENSLFVLVVLSVMLAIASWIALRSVPERRLEFYQKALITTFLVNISLLALITQCVLQTDPWFEPRVVIPLAGMIFASGMNAISLFIERYFSELTNGADQLTARNAAYTVTLIPTINAMLAVGLVSMPGMMTGQILSGVSPMIAVRYQIMIMLMLLSSSGLTAALFFTLIRQRET